MARGPAADRHGLAVPARAHAPPGEARSGVGAAAPNPSPSPSTNVPFVLAASVHLVVSILQSLAWGTVAVFIVLAMTLILTLAA